MNDKNLSLHLNEESNIQALQKMEIIGKNDLESLYGALTVPRSLTVHDHPSIVCSSLDPGTVNLDTNKTHFLNI